MTERLHIEIDGQSYVAPQEVVHLLHMVSIEKDFYRNLIVEMYEKINEEYPKE